MRVITESELRQLYRQQPFETYLLPPGTRLTPAASQFLQDFRINTAAGADPGVQPAAKAGEKERNFREQYLHSGEETGQEIPEHLTTLRGNVLVSKNNSCIHFRGKMDLFQSLVIIATVDVAAAGLCALAEELKELLDICRTISRVEVTEEPLPPISFRGWSDQEIRERSRYPEKHFGIEHFLATPSQGRMMATLNQLRATARELELAGISAFCSNELIERDDIIRALNRLSSIVYILMCRLLTGEYQYGFRNGV